MAPAAAWGFPRQRSLTRPFNVHNWPYGKAAQQAPLASVTRSDRDHEKSEQTAAPAVGGGPSIWPPPRRRPTSPQSALRSRTTLPAAESLTDREGDKSSTRR